MLPSLRTRLRAHRVGLRRGAVALALLYGLYLVAANVFLNSALAPAAFNRTPERFAIHWSRAWSLYPGGLALRDLRIGGHSGRNRWSAAAPQARGRVRLLPLLARRLSFDDIHGESVRFSLVNDAPERRSTAAPVRAADRWRLEFDGIHAESLESLQLADWRIDAFEDARASFAFAKVLAGNIEILPSSLQARSARLSWRGVGIARRSRIDYTMTMAPNSFRLGRGFDRIRFVDARLRLAGEGAGIALGGDGDLLRFADGPDRGRIEADLSIRRGVLEPGGRLAWQAPLALAPGLSAARGQRLRVEAAVAERGTRLRARVPPQPGRDDRIDADLVLGERRLQALDSVEAVLRALSGTASTRWTFGTLRWLDPLVTEGGWLRLDGRARVEADLQLTQGRLAPGSEARVADAEVTADIVDTVLTATARAHARVHEDRTTVEFLAPRFQVAPADAPGRAYLGGRDLRLDLVSAGDLADFRRNLKASLRFADARIPDLSAYNRNLPGESLRLDGGTGTLGADFELDSEGRIGRARLRLEGRDARVRLGGTRIGGDLVFDTRLVRAGGPRDYRVESLELRLDGVHVGDRRDDADWWARGTLEGATLRWQAPFRLHGDARLRMRDVSVLLDLFSERSAFPAWIARIVDAGEARATARVAVSGEAVVLDGIEARNDRVELDARLRIVSGVPRGALHARWGVLGVGAELDGDGRRLHLRDARRWYDAQPALLPPR